MEIAPPNMALVCVPSTAVINSQNVLPLSAEHSLLSVLYTLLTFPLKKLLSPYSWRIRVQYRKHRESIQLKK
jgi:hypothetical protein